MRYLISLTILFTITVSGFADVINVPADYSTIQSGLNAADSSDTVMVAAGTYQENIIWPETNGIKLIGQDSSNTIIDGDNSGPVINIAPTILTIDSITIIKDLTIQNGGNIPYGGGVRLISSSPNLENLILFNNSSMQRGSAIYTDSSNSKMSSLKVIQNSGTCIYLHDSDIAINGSKILSNDHGIRVENGSIELNSTKISDNGSGISTEFNDEIKLNDVIIKDNNGQGFVIDISDGVNTAVFFNKVMVLRNGSGGGILDINEKDSLIFKDVYFYQNYSSSGGGLRVIAYSDEQVDLSNIYVINNSAANGGGISSTGNVSYNNITLIGNIASSTGGGIRTGEGSIKNSVIYNNMAATGDGIYLIGGSLNVTHSSFFKNGYGFYSASGNISNADSNWWGHITGPYHPTVNTAGNGDSTSIYVDVDPWLTTPDTAAPPIPIQNVEVTELTNDYVSLSWDSSSIGDLAGYHVYFTTDTSSVFYSDTINVGNATSYTISNLQAGNYYKIAVTCYDDDGNESWYSEPVIVEAEPVPVMTYNPASLSFDNTISSDTSSQTITIENSGTADLHVTDAIVSGPHYSVDPTSSTMIPGASDQFTVSFHPGTYGEILDTLNIVSDAYNTPTIQIPLEGFGGKPSSPEILTIQDVPDDQGGQVRICFARSKYDGLDSTYTIGTYSVWRHIADDEWDAIGQFDAIQDSIYNFVSPTLYDSTTEGIYWSTFRVSAHTVINDTFFMSAPDSGYSIDNIAPVVPENLIALIDSNGIALQWSRTHVEDFQYYTIYRSQAADFQIDTVDALATTTDTIYIDASITLGETYYYRVTAFDDAGNESGASDIVSETKVGIDNEDQLPKEFSLSQNYPNPFNPTTTLKYGLPQDANVRLVIYNLGGRKVKTLLQKHQTAGWHQVQWDGTNEFGQSVSTGVYFYRLETEEFVDVKKMVFMK